MFELNIDTRIASVKRREKITAGSVGIQCRFAFSAEWDGLGKTAVFETDKHKIAVVLNTPAVTIPWEVCEEADLDVIVGVYGTNGNGTIVIPTIYAKLGTVAVGTTTDGAENAQTPTATDVQQITSAAANAVSTANTAKSTADEAKSIAQSVEQRANAGEFDGKDGAPLTVADRVYHGSTERPGWETLIFSDGSELEVKSGKNGVDGQTPYIGVNGNWWIPGKPSTNTIVPAIDTGKPSRGENGRDGIDGKDGAPGRDGADGAPGRDGIDGTSVTITDISESTESGGTSVVTFSDGKTLHVRNGLDGQGGGGSDVTKETVKEWGFAEEGNLGALRVYPNAEYPVDALAYHAQYDALVNAGIAHRSEPFYLSWDSAREYPIYTYRISPNEDWMTSGYSHNQNNDGSNPLYKRKKIFITSGLHGNERGTPNFLFEFFSKGLASEQTAKTLGSFDWVIIPLVNPWGYSNSFLNSSGAQVHFNPTYPGGGTLPSGYSVANNNSGYNAGIRRNREMIDINRDFSDAQYTSSSDTLGFVTEEARYVRDVFLAENPDMGFDLHQSGSDTSPGFCSFGVVSPQVLPADEFAELKPQLYTVIDQGNRLCDAAIQDFYDLPYGHQLSHVWNGTTTHTLRNYMSGYSSSGVGNADHKDKAVKYSFCIETDRRCSEIGGNSWHGEQSKIFGCTYVNSILCTVTDILNQPAGSGSDVTKDTVRGWGFAYQDEIPDIEQLTEDKDATDNSLADVLIGSGYLAPHTKNLQQGTFSRTDGRKLSDANADYYKRVRTIKLYAYGNATTFVCAEGYKMRMYYYGVASAAGGKEDTTTYTGKYTGWSRVITFPPMEYVAFVIKADDDREITAADVTDKIYKYVPPTIPEPVTDQRIIDVINAAYPNAEGVGF